jgi:hypothetical protein
MLRIGASFLFTGEILGRRPMSQHKRAVEIIDRESGFQGYILRPLSAANFEPTIPETKGWVDRSKLLNISGPSVILQGNSLATAVEKMLHYTHKPVQETALITHRLMGNNWIVSFSEILNKNA